MGARRLIVVAAADPAGAMDGCRPPRPDDVVVALDALAGEDLADRRPIAFDSLQSWEQRSAGEQDLAELLASDRGPSGRGGDRAPPGRSGDRAPRPWLAPDRLRRIPSAFGADRAVAGMDAERQVTRQAGYGAWDLRCDPARSPLRWQSACAPAWASTSRPRHMRCPRRSPARAAAVRWHARRCGRWRRSRAPGGCAWRLSPPASSHSHSLSLPTAELRGAGVGLMPFPGLDHGNGLLLAVRRGLPLLAHVRARLGRDGNGGAGGIEEGRGACEPASTAERRVRGSLGPGAHPAGQAGAGARPLPSWSRPSLRWPVCRTPARCAPCCCPAPPTEPRGC